MRRLLCSMLLAAVAVSCGRKDEDAPPVATIAVAPTQAAGAIGGPVTFTYRITVAAEAAAFPEDAVVFVHFTDASTGELLWTDDHQPPTPPARWTSGQRLEYTRTMFVPKLAFIGEAAIEVGLYSPRSGERLPLQGETVGGRAYRAGRFDVQPAGAGIFIVYGSGWHDPEAAADTVGVEWHWSRAAGVLSFRNPQQDVELLLDVDQPIVGIDPPQRVDVRIGETTVGSFAVPPGPRFLQRIPLSAAQLGTAEQVDVTLAVDRVVTPASIPGQRSADVRALGVRLFHAYVQPK